MVNIIIALSALLIAAGSFVFGAVQLRKKAESFTVEELEARIKRLEDELMVVTAERDKCFEDRKMLRDENFRLYRELAKAREGP